MSLKICFILPCLLLLSGCGSMQSYDYQDPREISSGPGLLTGEEGAFVIYRK